MTDVLIIGDGVAAHAAAIILQLHGKKATIIRREPNNQSIRVGESLTSSALVSIKELGLLNEFLADEHAPCLGNCSSWGNNKLAYYDFIQSPLGQGWYIDRNKFNSMLHLKAEACGAKFITAARTINLNKLPDGNWRFENGIEVVEAPFLIEASGRSNWLGRHLGIERVEDDKQVAVVSLLQSDNPTASSHSMIEAVSDGWWYVATAGCYTVCIFFTDPDLHQRPQLTDYEYLSSKKAQTTFIKHRVPGELYQPVKPIQLTAANSSSLKVFSGDGWFAAGDAACSMDPLSSHGIAFALRSGIDAGLAAAQCNKGNAAALIKYNETIQHAQQIYRQQRTEIYRQENRWRNFPYWKRRT